MGYVELQLKGQTEPFFFPLSEECQALCSQKVRRLQGQGRVRQNKRPGVGACVNE